MTDLALKHQPTVIERLAPTKSPMTSPIYIGRALLALATLITLLANSSWTLFHSPNPSVPLAPSCGGIESISLFCVLPSTEFARWTGIAILLLVLSGILPGFLSILHWYVTASVFWSIAPMEGGDQLSSIVSLLLIPIALSDGRIFLWSSKRIYDNKIINVVGNTSFLFICLQLAIVYFNSAVAKFSSPPWVEGTAMWYWMQHPAFGAPEWLQGPALDLLATSWGSATFTWGTILFELFIATSIFLPQRRIRLLGYSFGVLLHLGIAIVIGLVSFSLVMIATLTIVILGRFSESDDLKK